MYEPDNEQKLIIFETGFKKRCMETSLDLFRNKQSINVLLNMIKIHKLFNTNSEVD